MESREIPWGCSSSSLWLLERLLVGENVEPNASSDIRVKFEFGYVFSGFTDLRKRDKALVYIPVKTSATEVTILETRRLTHLRNYQNFQCSVTFGAAPWWCQQGLVLWHCRKKKYQVKKRLEMILKATNTQDLRSKYLFAFTALAFNLESPNGFEYRSQL